MLPRLALGCKEIALVMYVGCGAAADKVLARYQGVEIGEHQVFAIRMPARC